MFGRLGLCLGSSSGALASAAAMATTFIMFGHGQGQLRMRERLTPSGASVGPSIGELSGVPMGEALAELLWCSVVRRSMRPTICEAAPRGSRVGCRGSRRA